MATYKVIGQESAEAIVCMETTTLDGMVGGNEPGEAGRSHPAEGPNSKNGNRPYVLRNAMTPNG